MMSKKDMLTLGVLAVGGVAVASSFAGSGGSDTGALEGKKGRAGGILGSQQGYGAPSVYNFPAQGAVSFPEAPKFDIGSFLAPTVPVSRGAAGVSSAGKKYRETGVALGYKGYVTPTIPTPVSPGYVPGVTTFVPYKKPAYIPSPVKPPSVSYGGGGSSKKASTSKKYERRSQKGYTYSKTGSLTKK